MTQPTPELIPHTDVATGAQSKVWWTSKTLWVNIATVFVAAMLLPEVRDVLPDGIERVGLAIVGVLNILLRLLTTTAVTR